MILVFPFTTRLAMVPTITTVEQQDTNRGRTRNVATHACEACQRLWISSWKQEIHAGIHFHSHSFLTYCPLGRWCSKFGPIVPFLSGSQYDFLLPRPRSMNTLHGWLVYPRQFLCFIT
jgi:hypothetical protein